TRSFSSETSPIKHTLVLEYQKALATKALSWFRASPLRNAIRSTYYQSGRSRRRTDGFGYSGGNGRWDFFQRYLSSIPSRWIFYGILGINVLVYGAWRYSDMYWQFRDPSRVFFMLKHFTVSWDNFKQECIWTLITSCFSQSSATHALMNGLTFYFMAPAVLDLLGNARFLGLYLGGGLIASAVSLAWNHLTSGNPNYRSHGASGAILSTVAFFACAFPRTQFLVFFIVPVPAWACITGLFAWDLYSTVVRRQGSTVDSAGHVGGIVAGVLYCLRLRYKGFLV
ncbi:uncharacterized protein EI90DRAFT_2904405, partial [Cantharellus anzutake]|uniref:uncharacterized protein n=1 Tax=Cantharellus anzutake TaxID=1750568 RepID=UPI001906BDA5